MVRITTVIFLIQYAFEYLTDSYLDQHSLVGHTKENVEQLQIRDTENSGTYSISINYGGVFMTRLCTMFMLLVLPLNYGSAGEITPKIPFEHVINVKSPTDKKVLLGEIKKGIPALMLSAMDSSTCLAETVDIEVDNNRPNGPLTTTNLKIKRNCLSTNYLGALIGITKAKYKILKPRPFADNNLAKNIAMESKKFEPPNCPDYYRFSDTLPDLWSLPEQKAKFVIAEMKTKSNTKRLFFHKNKRTYALEGGCVNEIKIFSVGDRAYLKYIQEGCDSGVYIIRVYDLSGSEPYLVYQNGSLSV